MLNPRFFATVAMILAAAMTRLIPHPPNFTAIGALALFGGAYFRRRWLAFVVPIGAMLISDAIITSPAPVSYGCFLSTVALGLLLRERVTFVRVTGAAIAASVLFFLFSNFSVWWGSKMYSARYGGTGGLLRRRFAIRAEHAAREPVLWRTSVWRNGSLAVWLAPTPAVATRACDGWRGQMIAQNTPIACSWSGGKDSCLALWHAIRAGGKPVCLLTMFTEGGQRSRSHGLSREVLEAQAGALGLPLVSRAASWADYEREMISLLGEARARGAAVVVFGDIDIDDHRAWEERVCRVAGLEAALPLWQQDRLDILEDWWSAGFEARIVVARDGLVGRRFLGRVLDRPIAQELASLGVDACGENGEFHTLVTAGPLFRHPLTITLGQQVKHSDCWFQDLSLTTDRQTGL